VSKKSQSKNPLKQLEGLLDLYLVKKAPALPQNIKEVIVNFAPWITLILIVLAAPALMALFGLGTFFSPFRHLAGYRYGFAGNLSLLVLAVGLVFEAIAIPGLFKRTIASWRLVFYASLVNGVYSLLSGSIGNLIIGMGISLYILFQVKEYYTN